MRFKAELRNVSSFSQLLSSLVPLGKIAVLKLKPEEINIITLPDGAGPAQLWCTVGNGVVFNLDPLSFRLESNTNNEIYLELNTDAFARALKSAAGASKVIIKLAKKYGTGPSGSGKGAKPVLTLDIKSSTRSGHGMSVTHDIAVKVKKMSDVEQMKEPLCPPPDVSILLPPLQQLRTVVERLKSISSRVELCANWGGQLWMKTASDEATVQTEWRELRHPEPVEGEESQRPTDRAKFFSVQVEAKSLLKFLACSQIATVTIACVCENHCLILYVYLGKAEESGEAGVMTFFLPAVGTTGDD